MRDKNQIILENLYTKVSQELKDNQFQTKVPIHFSVINNKNGVDFESTEVFVTYEININYASWGINYINGRLVKISPIVANYSEFEGEDKQLKTEINPEKVEFLFSIGRDGQILPDELNVTLDENLEVVEATLTFSSDR